MDIENIIKKQFSKIFTKSDWYSFKVIAEYYFRTAASVRTQDIKIDTPYKLWVRNIQKRLFLGIAYELLLKAIYLKEGFYINLPLKNIYFIIQSAYPDGPLKIGYPEQLDDKRIDEDDEGDNEVPELKQHDFTPPFACMLK